MPLTQRLTRERPKRLLLVSDGELLRERLQTLLVRAGYAVRTVSGMAAVAQLTHPRGGEQETLSWHPDVILIDWNLSDGHPVEQLFYVRSHAAFDGIPCVLLGQKNSLYQWADFIQRQPFPPDAYLMKPFNPEELTALLHRLLDEEKRQADRL